MRQTVHWSKSALSRRRFLPAGRATLVTGTVSSLSPRGSAAATVALRQLAADKGLLYGTIIAVAQITCDRPFTDLVRRGEILCLSIDFLNGPLLVCFFSLPGNHRTMEEKAHADHSDPARAL